MPVFCVIKYIFHSLRYKEKIGMKQYIFADESSTAQSRFMLLGGIWVDEITYNYVKNECNNFKIKNKWNEQTKFNWKSVSNKSLQSYKTFIDIFFNYNLKFNCIIIDKKEIDLKNNPEQDEELGFYKFYYQLLLHNSPRNNVYYIYLDRRNNKKENRLEELKYLLQKDIFNFNQSGEPSISQGIDVKTLEFVNYNNYSLIQFTDILLGAIGYHYNHRHLKEDASHNKIELAMYIANKINKNNLIFNTEKEGYKNMNIWLFKPYKTQTLYGLHFP